MGEIIVSSHDEKMGIGEHLAVDPSPGEFGRCERRDEGAFESSERGAELDFSVGVSPPFACGHWLVGFQVAARTRVEIGFGLGAMERKIYLPVFAGVTGF